MKQKLIYLFSLMLLCIFGTSGISARQAIFSPAYMTGQAADTGAGTVANNIFLGNGTDMSSDYKIQITGNLSKGLTNQGTITINSTSYNSFKNSNGAEMTITLPTGQTAYAVDFYVTANADADATLSSFEGSSCSDVVDSHKDGANPTKISKTLTTPANSFKFNFGTNQVLFVAVVHYLLSTDAPEFLTDISSTLSTRVGIASTLTVQAIGNTSYQWYTCDDADKTNPKAIEGADEASYSYTAESEGDKYIYCAATNTNGTTTSTVCKVTATASSFVAVTFGLTRPLTVDTTDPTKGTMGAPVMSSTNSFSTLAQVMGTGVSNDAQNRTYNIGGVAYTATNSFRKDASLSDFSETQFAGYTFTVPSGKKLELTQVDARFSDASNATWTWKISVQNSKGNVLWESDNKTTTGNSTTTVTLTDENDFATALANLTAGTYYAKIYFYQGGSSKCNTIDLTFNGNLGDDEGEVVETINVSAIINNQTGTILTSDEMAAQGNAVSFGLNAENARVAADSEDAKAVVTGNYHNDHGCTGVSIAVAVPGAVKIGIGQCSYSSSNIVVKNSSNVTVINKTPTAACWKNDHSNITYQFYTGDATTLTISGMAYCPFFSVSSVDMCELTGTISGGTINGSNVVFTSTLTGQTYSATVADGAFTVSVPADTYNVSLDGVTDYVLSSPTSLAVTEDDDVTINLVSSTEQTVSGTIANAPAEDFVLTFTASSNSSNTQTLNCSAGATSYTIDLMPDTYTMSSSVGTLSTISAASFQIVSAAVSHNIYFPETIPVATQQNITVDNTLVTATANNYKSVSDALAAAKAGSISSPVITLTSGQTYREQVIVDQANVTLKTSGADKATITFYYGIGYGYYSLNADGYYDKDRAMTRNSKLTVSPARWGATVLVKSTASGFYAENIIFENSFNQYYTTEEVADGVAPNGLESITYDRTLTSGQAGYKAADARAVTERAAAIGFENSPTGCEVYNCTFISSQDTYYTSGTLYAKNCTIQGNTDYIFGGGSVVFDNCNLVIGGYSDQAATAYITAYKDKDGEPLKADKKYIFRDCSVTKTNRTYIKGNLGRDWGGAAASVYYFNLDNTIGSDFTYGWSDMGGAVTTGTADLHIYDFDPTVNANYSTTGSTGANINGVVSDADALDIYGGVVDFLGFTPQHIYDDNVVLGESSAYNKCRIAASDNVERTVDLTRAISAGNWSTIVLPFAMTEAQLKAAFGDDVKVAELDDNSTDTNLSFTTVTATEANKPYAIKVSSAVATATIENVTIVEATPTQEGIANKWSAVGTYLTGQTIPTGSFYFSNNQLKKAGATGTHSIKPFRAYFTYTGAGEEPNSLDFTIDKDEATAIEGITSEVGAPAGAIYTISGQRVSQPVNGVNIINGIKFVK